METGHLSILVPGAGRSLIYHTSNSFLVRVHFATGPNENSLLAEEFLAV